MHASCGLEGFLCLPELARADECSQCILKQFSCFGRLISVRSDFVLMLFVCVGLTPQPPSLAITARAGPTPLACILYNSVVGHGLMAEKSLLPPFKKKPQCWTRVMSWFKVKIVFFFSSRRKYSASRRPVLWCTVRSTCAAGRTWHPGPLSATSKLCDVVS